MKLKKVCILFIVFFILFCITNLILFSKLKKTEVTHRFKNTPPSQSHSFITTKNNVMNITTDISNISKPKTTRPHPNLRIDSESTINQSTATHQLNSKESELRENKNVSYNVHAFYYSWYGSKSINKQWSHWNHKTLPHWLSKVNEQYPQKQHQPPDDIASQFYPSLGPYSSTDPSVIRNHMEQLIEAGIGVLAISWYPPHKQDDSALIFVDDYIPLIMDIAEEYHEKVCFHIEPYQQRTALSVRDDIKYLIDTYGNHPAFYRYDNKPLIYIYDSYIISGHDWSTIFSPSGEFTIRNTPYDVIAIGLYVEKKHYHYLIEGHFNGLYTYFAAERFVYSSTLKNWEVLNNYASRLQPPSLFIPSVGPGYNDIPVRPWNGINIRSRDNGTYYMKMWKAALQWQPKVVSITSFNEWHEGSQIERAVPKKGYEDYGENTDFYLELTKTMVKAMKTNVCCVCYKNMYYYTKILIHYLF